MTNIKAVCWDFGGVILSNPFEAFNRYEEGRGLPRDFIRTLNATNPDTNAWSKLERNEVDFAEFSRLFEAEAEAAGGALDAMELMPLLAGELRPQMVEAVRRCHERLKTALLTNNWVSSNGGGGAGDRERDVSGVMEFFDVIVESSKAGVRKPDPAFYQLALDQLGVEPEEAVFLDDLGVNLKPARALGMTTIKVIDPDDALDQLEAVVGFPVRA
jgi:putative hydrolase of the HAD superfamily